MPGGKTSPRRRVDSGLDTAPDTHEYCMECHAEHTFRYPGSRSPRLHEITGHSQPGLAAAIHLSAAPVGMLRCQSGLPGGRRLARAPWCSTLAGCSGGNASPALQWSHVPAGTRSFAITLFDVDEKATPSGWWHWIVYDIPATTRKLEAGAGTERSARLPAGTIQGRSDLGNAAYHGPCPAKGDPPHRYLFTIYALERPPSWTFLRRQTRRHGDLLGS